MANGLVVAEGLLEQCRAWQEVVDAEASPKGKDAAASEAEGDSENAGNVALGIAAAGALINAGVARRTHGASHDHDAEEHCHGAHEDSKLHTLTDASTGFIYLAGLAAERKVPGIANVAIMINGSVVTFAGAKTLFNISRTEAIAPTEPAEVAEGLQTAPLPEET